MSHLHILSDEEHGKLGRLSELAQEINDVDLSRIAEHITDLYSLADDTDSLFDAFNLVDAVLGILPKLGAEDRKKFVEIGEIYEAAYWDSVDEDEED